MNELLEKYDEFKAIINYTVEYKLKNEQTLCFKLKQLDFPHLIGLHKLIDIPIIRQFNDKGNKKIGARYIVGNIKKEDKLTDETIRNSKYFHTIQNRYHQFGKDNLLTLFYADAIINFDAAIINSNLKTSYILFEQKGNKSYNHLCIAEDANGNYYTESFFHEPSDLYIRKQKTSKVKTVRIYDKKGVLYMEDMLLDVV